MKNIIEDNYKSIVDRGLITSSTKQGDFHLKLQEEIIELFAAKTPIEYDYELADIILVCLNIAKHYDIDIEYYLKEKIKINFDRAKNNK